MQSVLERIVPSLVPLVLSAKASPSSYAGYALGPATLRVEDCFAAPNLVTLVRTTLLEGCIGELVAAAEARELASCALDPTVRRVLSEIADDESRHAALLSICPAAVNP